MLRLGRTLDFSTKYGAIESIDGDTAIVVEESSGRRVKKALSELRSTGQKSAVNDFVQAVFERNRAKP